MEALLEERGVRLAHAPLQRGVVKSRPVLAAALHRRQRQVGGSGRREETDITSKGPWYALYRAVDTRGQPIDGLRTKPRDARAAQRFLTKAMGRHGVPAQMTSAGSAVHKAAMESDNEAHRTTIPRRQTNYLHKSVEPAQRAVKRLTRPRLGGKAGPTARRRLVGIALLHMLKTPQLEVGAEDEGRPAAALFYSLAA